MKYDEKTVNWHRKNKTVIGVLYKRWTGQRSRCNSPNDHRYKHYGEKGICVKYSFDELVEWFMGQDFKGDINDMAIGRIDHDKNYSLDNINLETKRESVMERNLRNPNKMKPVLILDAKSKEPLMWTKSVAEAAWLTENKDSNICRILKGRRSSLKGFAFEYYRGAA